MNKDSRIGKQIVNVGVSSPNQDFKSNVDFKIIKCILLDILQNVIN